MIMRKSPRNDVENPPGQIVWNEDWCSCTYRSKKDCPGEWEPGCDLGANEQHVIRAVNSNSNVAHQGKPLVKELSEYEELLRKNNSENSR